MFFDQYPKSFGRAKKMWTVQNKFGLIEGRALDCMPNFSMLGEIIKTALALIQICFDSVVIFS